MKSFLIKTWSCKCGYAQDFEPTKEAQQKHFNEDKNFSVSSVRENQCPSCALKGKEGVMSQEANADKKIKVHVMGEEEVDNLVFHGKQMMSKENADVEDESLKKDHVKRENQKELDSAMEEGRAPDFTKEKSAAVLPTRKELTDKQKTDLKKKIQDEIAHWKQEEDKQS